uniref:Uncharacterized protein n=1 Tax=Oryza barthii TaxID=65489 RepID=A0A0D3EIS7_9ORYZ
MVTTGERERESSPAPEVAEEQEIEGSSPAVARWWPERDDDDRDLRSRSMSICFRREWPLWRNSSSLAFLAKNSLAAVAVVVSISGVTSVSQRRPGACATGACRETNYNSMASQLIAAADDDHEVLRDNALYSQIYYTIYAYVFYI